MPKRPCVDPKNTHHANADTKAKHTKGRIVQLADECREGADYQQPEQGERIVFKVIPDISKRWKSGESDCIDFIAPEWTCGGRKDQMERDYSERQKYCCRPLELPDNYRSPV